MRQHEPDSAPVSFHWLRNSIKSLISTRWAETSHGGSLVCLTDEGGRRSLCYFALYTTTGTHFNCKMRTLTDVSQFLFQRVTHIRCSQDDTIHAGDFVFVFYGIWDLHSDKSEEIMPTHENKINATKDCVFLIWAGSLGCAANSTFSWH